MKDSWTITSSVAGQSGPNEETFKVPLIQLKPFQRWLKRALDILFSGVGVIALSPLLVIVALVVKLDSAGPVMFNRPRIGKRGTPFVMYKFRTMHKDAESRLQELAHLNEGGQHMIKIRNDPRVTRVGRFLRKTSLDELPQLINVLKGEMSLVGPRPQAPNEVMLYDEHQRRRLEVVPGITGLWQVTSRDDPSFDKWVELDLEYIDSWSFVQDLKIVLKTFEVVLKARGSTKSLPEQEYSSGVLLAPRPTLGERTTVPLSEEHSFEGLEFSLERCEEEVGRDC